ncbi:Kae1-associated kinase Bud32 [Caldisphaera sp.]|uniref:Kae1-associated kinase Bud32 n=1 Tax=Caldisphaera sp. TaxID=2060322 RepID=UPI003D0D4CDC
MVLFNDLINLESFLKFQLLKRGAESEIRLGSFADVKAIYKIRTKKDYMEEDLDIELRYSRTKKEAKILSIAYANGVNVPRIYAVYPSIGVIVMEYIYGITLKDLLINGNDESLKFSYLAGKELAKIHKSGIVHNDFTTSNIIIKEQEVYIIDFGLSEYSANIEDRAVDIHLYKRAVESTHARISSIIFNEFRKGYIDCLGSDKGEEIIKRSREIELRGRYVGERKTVWKP